MSKRLSYLLKDVMQNKFDNGFIDEDLWKLTKNKKIITYNMNDVKHWIYKPCWSFINDEVECFYSIYQVLLQKTKFKEDIKRIKKADTTFPLIVVEDEFDKYGSIIDGNHRFAKLLCEKSKTIKIKFITKKELQILISKK
jgi:hypothetical protein